MIDLETLKFLQSAQENLFRTMEMKQGGMIDFAAIFKHIETILQLLWFCFKHRRNFRITRETLSHGHFSIQRYLKVSVHLHFLFRSVVLSQEKLRPPVQFSLLVLSDTFYTFLALSCTFGTFLLGLVCVVQGSISTPFKYFDIFILFF